MIIHWICREDFGIERNQSPEKLSTVTHNSVFAAHRLKNAVPRLRDGIFLFLRAMQTLRMIIEMRTYKIKTGRRGEFLKTFESIARPDHENIAMKILALFLSVEQKRIPNLDFLLTGSSPLLETPLQNFLVRAALQRTNRQFVVIYSEESGAARVEHSRIIVHADKIIRRQFAARF